MYFCFIYTVFFNFLICYLKFCIICFSFNPPNSNFSECIPYKADERAEANAEASGNTFKIIFQSNDTKKKIDMSVHKVSSFLYLFH